MKKTLVLGASPNPTRYAYLAVQRLLSNGYEVVPLGIRKNATIGELAILNGQPILDDIHTITLYLNSSRQQPYYDYMLSLKPSRIIFNPGTENTALINLAKTKGIDTVIACTLVMLSTNQY